MSLYVFKRGFVAQLKLDIEKNIERYLSGDFNDLLGPDIQIPIKDTDINLNLINDLVPLSGGKYDVENSMAVYSALTGLSRYLARDERLWVWLTHTHCLDFTRKRWLSEKMTRENLISSIKAHFFVDGSRGFERTNAVASLWWWAEIASRYKNADHYKTLEVLLHQTDVRSSIIERPTSSLAAFTPIMNVLISKYDSEDRDLFFRRVKNIGLYRKWLTEINRHGGLKLYESMPENELTDLFHRLAS